jgi:DNA-binding protein HU-beta
MTMQALTDSLADHLEISTSRARSAVQRVFDDIADALVDGAEERIAGFGTFSVHVTPARDGRHPRTGEPIKIAAQRKVKFKPSKALRDEVNAGQPAQRRRA